MDRTTFAGNLESAAKLLLPFTRSLISNALPDEVRFLVQPNATYDGNPLEDDEQRFPNDVRSGPLTAEQAVERLWRDGKVPEWINLSVHSYDVNFTYAELLCCGRFTALDRHLYHRAEGRPPFHILGPTIPPGWRSPELSGKFDLNWFLSGSGTRSAHGNA